jgi:hypothetical protein
MLHICFVHVFVRIIKNTHRHPANQALHLVGAPFYVIGLAMTCGYFAGIQNDLVMGIAMWLAAVALFVSGHRIENNMGSMTPVLFFRLVSKIAHNFVAQQVHFLRA